MEQTLKILVAEDEAFNALRLKRALSRAGYEVCGPVSTGEQAIALADAEEPNLLLMDIRLVGGIDGIEATRQILTRHAVPVIFMSGYENRETVELAATLHPAAYLVKPVMIEEIQSAITNTFCTKNGYRSAAVGAPASLPA